MRVLAIRGPTSQDIELENVEAKVRTHNSPNTLNPCPPCPDVVVSGAWNSSPTCLRIF